MAQDGYSYNRTEGKWQKKTDAWCRKIEACFGRLK